MDASQSLDSDGNIVEYKYMITDQDGVITEVIQAEAILDRTISTGGVLTIALSVKDNLDLYSDVVTKSFEIDVLPPMPDEVENNSTIAGIDSDGDGVRDDVERYIASLPELDNIQKVELIKFVKVLQKSMIDANNKEVSIINTRNQFNQSYCLKSIIQEETVKDLEVNLKIKTYNRKHRLLEWAKIQDHFAGQIVYIETDKEKYGTYCD